MVDIKSIIAKEKDVVFGAERTVKNLKMGKAKKVFLASDCREDTKDSIMKYAKIAEVEVEQLKLPSEEIGMICKRQFPISVLSY